MDFNQLRYLVRAVELRSISEAAKSMGVSQPAVTKGLRSLEQELGAELLERTRRGVKPTAIGEIFFEQARAILTRAERGIAALERAKGERPMTLRIGTTPSFVDYLLPTVIARFASAWPAAEIRVHKALYPELVGLLQTDEIDAAFAIRVEAADRPGVDMIRLLPAETAFFVNPSHPLANVASISPAQLYASRWVMLDSDDVRRYFDALFQQAGLAAPRPSLLTNSMRLLKTTVMEAEFIGFLPAYMVSGEFESGALCRLGVQGGQAGQYAGLFFAGQNAQRPEISALIEHAQEVAEQIAGPIS